MFARILDRRLQEGRGVLAGAKVANDGRPDPRFVNFRLQPAVGVAAISKTDPSSQSPTTRAVTSTQSGDPKRHLREGAIYSDHSNNIIQLLSINSDYCAYAYLALGTQRAEMHGSVTALTRRNVFESGFIFVAECVDEWKRKQSNVSNGLHAFPVPPSLDSIDFTLLCQPQKRRA
jgi:hypothetical protein